MNKTYQVSLPLDAAQLVEQLAAQGQFPSVNDAISSAILLMKDRELLQRAKFESLQRDIMLGVEDIERGNISEFNAEDIIAEGRRILAKRQGKA